MRADADSRRRPRAVGPVGVALVLLLGLLAGTAERVDAVDAPKVAMVDVRSLIVHPSSGLVVISGDDRVEVRDADGAIQGSLGGLAGPSGLVPVGDDQVAVVETTGNAIQLLDVTTTTAVASYPTGVAPHGSVTLAGGRLWFTSVGSGPLRGLHDIDLATGTVTDHGLSWPRATVHAVPGHPDRLLVEVRDGLDLTVHDLDISGTMAAPIASSDPVVGLTTGDLVVDEGGAHVYLPTSNQGIVTLDYPGLSHTASPAGSTSSGTLSNLAYSPGLGGVLVQGVNAVLGARLVDGRRQGSISTGLGDGVQLVALSPDGRRAYAVERLLARGMAVVDLGPTITSVMPSSVIAGTPATITVSGSMLAGVEEVDVDGIPVAFTTSNTTLRLTLPVDESSGTRTLTLRSPLGSAVGTVAATPFDPGTLTVWVHERWGDPIGGVALTLTGGALAGPVTGATGPDGRHTFEGLSWGSDHRLELHDPQGRVIDEVVTGIAVSPGADVDQRIEATPRTASAPGLVGPTPPGGGLRWTLDPGTGAVLLRTGDDLMTFDPSIPRMHRDLATEPAGTAVLDGTTYAVDEGGPVVAVDAAAATTSVVADIGQPVDLGVAAAGGRLWFTTDTPTGALGSIDPATGATTITAFAAHDAVLGAVPDAPLLLVKLDGSPSVGVVDVSGGEPVLAYAVTGFSPNGAAASAAADRLWLPAGETFELSTGAPVTPVATSSMVPPPAVAHSAQHGGLLLVGDAVVAAATGETLVEVAELTAGSALFSADGTHLHGEYGFRLATFDLLPQVDEILPAAVVAGVPTEVVIRGRALGSAEVQVDGQDVAVLAGAPDELRVAVPTDRPAGTSTVEVTTPIGTTSVPLTIDENVGAVLHGTVRGPDGPVAGAVLTLTGDDLPGPAATTTGVDGSYAFAPQPLSEGLRLHVDDPTDDHIAQSIVGIALRPNDDRRLDVDLSATTTAPEGGVVSANVLSGSPFEVVDVPGHHRHVGATGDEVVVVDDQGRLRGRVVGSGQPVALAVEGSTVWAGDATGHLIGIDILTMAVGPTVPVGDDAGPDLVAAGGRLWFTTGDGASIGSYDLGDGSVVVPAIAGPADGLALVVDRPDELLAWEDGTVRRFDVGAAPTQLMTYELGPCDDCPADVGASATLDRLWTTAGDELDLSSGDPSGTTYDVPADQGAVAPTSRHDGLLALGQRLFRIGDGRVIERLDGGSVAWPDEDGTVIVGRYLRIDLVDLAPFGHLAPSARPSGDGGLVTIAGTGLGSTTAVRVDGTPMAFSVDPYGVVTFDLPASFTSGYPEPSELAVEVDTVVGTTTLDQTLRIGAKAPAPPRWVEADANQFVRIGWSAPEDEGSGPVTGYVVTVGTEEYVVGASQDELYPTSVPDGEVEITVEAVNEAGRSEPATTTVTADAMPTLWPTGRTAVAGAGFVRVSWSPPSFTGSGPLVAYEIADADLSRVISVPADRLEATLVDLPAGVPVELKIRARNIHGASRWVSVPSATPTPPLATFTDVDVDRPLYWEIWSAVDQGITTGFDDGTFRPDDVVTRQAAVTFLWRAAGSPTGFPDPGFADVAATNPFRPAIAWAVATGVTTGYADGSFRPTDPVSRQSWLAFQHRAAGAPTGPFPDPGFSDVPATHPFALPIAWAVDQAITTGYVDGTFRPTDPVTRQAAVAFLVRPTWPTWEPVG